MFLDAGGVIQDVTVSSEGPIREQARAWIGRAWIDTVTVESRPKVEDILREVATGSSARWRQVNHPSARGPDIPVRYAVVRLGPRMMALGRDLSGMAVLQQRLVEAQLSMEREYSRLRLAETRYRLLFHIASEAVLIVDAGSGKVVEANPASARLFGQPTSGLAGRPLNDLFETAAGAELQALLNQARASGRADGQEPLRTRAGQAIVLTASMFRNESGANFLLRLKPADLPGSGPAEKPAADRLGKLLAAFPDGFVVTSPNRRILSANRAFLDLAQIASAEHAIGEPVDRWLGRSSIDFNVLAANLKEFGAVRHFPTVVRGEYGTSENVEVSAVSVLQGDEPSLGFAVRAQSRRPSGEARTLRQLPRSVEQLTDLIGRVPLKELVRETTDVIERLCIEAALQLTGDNRASAAQMLGLSRQSLYVKLRRYGLADSDAEPEGD